VAKRLGVHESDGRTNHREGSLIVLGLRA
jgi:hypothetical protein